MLYSPSRLSSSVVTRRTVQKYRVSAIYKGIPVPNDSPEYSKWGRNPFSPRVTILQREPMAIGAAVVHPVNSLGQIDLVGDFGDVPRVEVRLDKSGVSLWRSWGRAT